LTDPPRDRRTELRWQRRAKAVAAVALKTFLQMAWSVTVKRQTFKNQKLVGSTQGRVAIKWFVFVWVTDGLQTGKPSRYITKHQG